MYNGLYTIDFHTHIQDITTQLKLCPEDRNSSLFRLTEPIFNRIANLSEPVHDCTSRHLAMHFKGGLSRYLYTKLGKLGLMEALRLFKTYSVDRLLKRMNRNGIDHAVIHSIEPLTATSNILEMTSAHRDRISVFASVERENPDPVGYLKTFVDDGTVGGIKIHPIVGGYACGELAYRMHDVVALAQRAHLPVMIHTGHIPVESLSGLRGCTEVQSIRPLIESFPDVKFVLAHIGWESWRQVLQLASDHRNTLVETSWQPAEVIRRAVDKLGSSRVLFGSDFPLFNQTMALNQVKQALTPREFVEVASVNGRRLLHLPGKQRNAV